MTTLQIDELPAILDEDWPVRFRWLLIRSGPRPNGSETHLVMRQERGLEI